MKPGNRLDIIGSVLLMCCALIGCGGGGGSADRADDATGLSVDVGVDRTVVISDTLILDPLVTLDGIDAGNRVTYQWRQLSGPGSAVISDASSVTPEITFSANGSYRIALDVTTENQTISDEVQVTVNSRASGNSGLETAPSNTSQCIAPADAAIPTSGVRLMTPYPGLPSLSPLVGLIKAPGDTTHWYALRQTGEVMRFIDEPSVNSLTSFLDIRDRVDYGGEKGLLGMTFHPDFADNGYAYLSYTASSLAGLESRISRFSYNDATQTLDPASERIILAIRQPYANHNGGQIDFGPDGMLYIGFGDGGSGGDPDGNGQNSNTLLGALLRIDVGDGSGSYTIPSDNPFVTGGGAPEVFAFGLRNPWRWSFDRLTGALWLGDVGQNEYEEVDLITRGGNFGWNTMEGEHCFPASSACDRTGLLLPVTEYDHTQGLAITGGYVYRGSELPFLQGSYLYGDHASGRVWSLQPNGAGGYITEALLDTSLNIASFAEDQNGELYILNLAGTIHKITGEEGGSAGTVPATLSGWGCFQSDDVAAFSDNVIPYEINSLLWSDFAGKERFMAIPSGSTVAIDTQGRFIYPPGSVLGKHFRINGRLIETRLLLNHEHDGWVGYSYEWNSELDDAELLTDTRDKVVDGQSWHYPSPAECLLCHTNVAGITLGPEIGQLNRDFVYPDTTANQLITLESIGLLADSLTDEQKSTAYYAIDDSVYSTERRARSYLHSNCAGCHQPGGPGGGDLDLRMSAAFTATGLCNRAPQGDSLGLTTPVLLKPGDPDHSILVLRMENQGDVRMPPLASSEVDAQALSVIREWIAGLANCD
ncbi:MAG: PQQ-dependent sugar dehydrogenase [Candidatus Thiodiazotropha endolucinida]